MRRRKDRTKIMIICGSFAPSAIVGAKRFTFLSIFLKKQYSTINILTRKESYFSTKDYTLPINGTLHRVGMYPAYPLRNKSIFGKILNRLWRDYFCLIDPFSGWIIPGILKGLKVIRKEKINLIIATCPMFSSIVIAYLLSLITNTKIILDYRDPWSNHNRKFCKLYGKAINHTLERLSVRRASALIFCSKAMKENFIKHFGKYIKAKCTVIHNGYLNRDEVQPLSLGKKAQNIVYAGSLFKQRKISLLAKPIRY
jgi:glycosyltransferase involved in cell wall biosynthesis